MLQDVVYGRVKPLSSNLQGMRIRKVTVVYSLNDFTLFKKEGKYLSFVTNEGEYRIFNPFGIAFDLNRLISQLKTYHCVVCGEEFVSCEIKSVE